MKKVKLFCFLISFVVSGTLFLREAMAMAAFQPPTLEILSFARVSDNEKDYSAEVCGIIKGNRDAKAAYLVQLIMDKDGNAPRVYYTYSGRTGLFCAMVVTLEGTVHATLDGVESLSARAQAKLKEKW